METEEELPGVCIIFRFGVLVVEDIARQVQPRRGFRRGNDSGTVLRRFAASASRVDNKIEQVIQMPRTVRCESHLRK